jgi:outer membrane protein TolC
LHWSSCRLAEHLIHFEQDADVARARLNTFLGRDPVTPINVRGDYAVPARMPETESLEKLALTSRPDLAQAQAAVQKLGDTVRDFWPRRSRRISGAGTRLA